MNAQEKLELTAEQQRAFNRLKRAFKDSVKLGVRFEMSSDTLIALNGHNVVGVEEGYSSGSDEIELQDVDGVGNSFSMHISPWIDCDVCVTVKSSS